MLVFFFFLCLSTLHADGVEGWRLMLSIYAAGDRNPRLWACVFPVVLCDALS
jgi:hypothetical protein